MIVKFLLLSKSVNTSTSIVQILLFYELLNDTVIITMFLIVNFSYQKQIS